MTMHQTVKALAARLLEMGDFDLDTAKGLLRFDAADDAQAFLAREMAIRAFLMARETTGHAGFSADFPERPDPDDERIISRARQSGAQMIHPAESKVRPGAVSETNPDRMRSITSPEQDGIRNANNASVARGLGNLRGIDVGDTAGPPVLKGEAEGETPTHGPHHWEEPRKFPAALAAVLAEFEGKDAMQIARENDLKQEVDRLSMEAEGFAREAEAIRAGATPGWEGLWRSKMDEAHKLMEKAKQMLAGGVA